MLSFSLSNEKQDLIISKIKEKEELKGISNEVIKNELNKFLKQNPKIQKQLNESTTNKLLKSKALEVCKKEIRKVLRYYTGMFEINNKERKQLLHANKITELLKTHLSTKERYGYYDEIYNKIFKITKKPNSILDLGCGLNPLSLPEEFMKNIKYYAGDINQDDLEIVNEYFRKNKFEGDVFFYDLKLQKLGVFGTSNKLAYCKNANDHLPKTDVCFLFKVLDLIDNKGHKNAEKVLKQIPAKFVIVSFSKITLSGKKLNASRNWLKLLIERLRWKYYLFETENEMFFVINKS